MIPETEKANAPKGFNLIGDVYVSDFDLLRDSFPCPVSRIYSAHGTIDPVKVLGMLIDKGKDVSVLLEDLHSYHPYELLHKDMNSCIGILTVDTMQKLKSYLEEDGYDLTGFEIIHYTHEDMDLRNNKLDIEFKIFYEDSGNNITLCGWHYDKEDEASLVPGVSSIKEAIDITRKSKARFEKP